MALYSTSIRRLQYLLKTNIKDIAEECCCLSKLGLITEQKKNTKKQHTSYGLLFIGSSSSIFKNTAIN